MQTVRHHAGHPPARSVRTWTGARRMIVVHYLDPRTWRPLCDAEGRAAGSRELEDTPAASPWTFVKESVTCPECLRALEERERGAGST